MRARSEAGWTARLVPFTVAVVKDGEACAVVLEALAAGGAPDRYEVFLALVRSEPGARRPRNLTSRPPPGLPNSRNGGTFARPACRPWRSNLTEWSKVRVAQLRYSADTYQWSLYWADRDGRWHRYDVLDSSPADKVLIEIEDDPTCISWG